MALVTKRIYIDTASQALVKVPTGASYNTTASSLGTATTTETKSYAIAADGVVNATKATAFAAIITALTTAIDTQIAAVGGFGINTTLSDVSYNAKITNIVRGDDQTDYLLPATSDFINVTVQLTLYVTGA